MPRKKDNTPEDDEDDLQANVEESDVELDALAANAADIELTEAEKMALEKEARAEVMKHLKAAKAKQFKANAKQRIQAEMMFRTAKDMKGNDLVTVDLHLASHPKFIMLDGAVYHSGKKHTVTKDVAAVLLDQMHRGWEQEFNRLSPEAKSNLQQQRAFILKRQSDGSYGLTQVA